MRKSKGRRGTVLAIVGIFALALSTGAMADTFGNPECYHNNVQYPLPLRGPQDQNNNEQVKIENMVAGTIHACAGSIVTLQATEGYDCDVVAASGCSPADCGGGAADACAKNQTNSDVHYDWIWVSGPGSQIDEWGTLTEYSRWECPRIWPTSFVVKARRPQAAGDQDTTTAKEYTTITIIVDAPPSIGPIMCSSHAMTSLTPSQMELKFWDFSYDTLLHDEDPDATYDTHCCKVLYTDNPTPYYFYDSDIDPSGFYDKYYTIDSVNKENMIFWNAYSQIMAVSSIYYCGGKYFPSGGPACTGGSISIVEAGHPPSVWGHEYGHQKGLGHAGGDPPNVDTSYQDNFMFWQQGGTGLECKADQCPAL